MIPLQVWRYFFLFPDKDTEVQRSLVTGSRIHKWTPGLRFKSRSAGAKAPCLIHRNSVVSELKLPALVHPGLLSLYLSNFSFDCHRHPGAWRQERPRDLSKLPKTGLLSASSSAILPLSRIQAQGVPCPTLLIHVLVPGWVSQSSEDFCRSEGWRGPSHIPCRENQSISCRPTCSQKEQLISTADKREVI